MEKRKFGRTNHMSTVAIFGAAALMHPGTEQAVADAAVETALRYGVNHIDVAPSYGDAERLIGPWIKRLRSNFFIGCKTTQRTRHTALSEMHSSLDRLQTDHFDLYQCHAVNDMTELDQVTVKGGALEGLIEAKKCCFTQFLGITAHGMQAPDVLIEALNRYEFDSVLFPLNFILFGVPEYRQSALRLMDLCQQKNVGMMTIKSIARGRWGDHEKTWAPWYEPFTDDETIQKAVNFVLSHPVTGICTVSDTTLLPRVLDACEHFQLMDQNEMEALSASGKQFVTEPLF